MVETEAALRSMKQDQHAQLAHLEDMRALFKVRAPHCQPVAEPAALRVLPTVCCQQALLVRASHVARGCGSRVWRVSCAQTELAELRDESWKREAYDELERFKQQLALNEAAVDGSSGGAEVETTVVSSMGKGATVGQAEADESEALLDELDAEMAAIEKQLNDARALRDEMAGRKLALQAEMDEFLTMEQAEARGRRE
jgi:hypothetical protein